jgi:hypothetical protein
MEEGGDIIISSTPTEGSHCRGARPFVTIGPMRGWTIEWVGNGPRRNHPTAAAPKTTDAKGGGGGEEEGEDAE